ncbi:flagellar protein FliT [Janthinobacterium sp. CG_23.3]|uniref:flagellar protein FliT n=1 Tax=unclassified Janthinobacterium TaxID=2610881 RepID=UPI0005648E4E|nr:flagellar protein FliT [Janthinobacterium sp. CG3]
MTSQEVLAIYESMVDLTEQMVRAASDADWDLLGELEQRCAAQVRLLKDGEEPPALKGQSRQTKVDCIKKMLDDDRKIRDLTMPWMAQLSALIHSTGTERRLANVYGAT